MPCSRSFSPVRHCLLGLIVAGATAPRAEGQAIAPGPREATRRAFFEEKVRPVLAAQCYSCHGAGKQEGNLRVDHRDGLLRGGDAGPAVVAGRPEESPLIAAVAHTEPGMEMPKGAPKLPPDVIDNLRTWVADGAHDPRVGPPSAEDSARAAWEATLAERRRWWSLQPPADRPVPPVRDASWPLGPVDRFVLAALEQRGLTPSPPADRALLARRAAFVLTGLAPRADDLRAYLADRSPLAYERLVDRLLASPHFGEHWARHWMDVVRYGDTYGYEWDIPAKGAWRYRDYLVRAFNDDVPFDRLVREQIAGDLLDDPRIDASQQINASLVGPMFFQLGEKRHGDSADFDGIHQEMLHNKIDALSKAFQGLTVGCARCHDHKLDAVAQRDYYALAGALFSPRWVVRTLDTPDRNAAALAELRRLKGPIRAALADRWRAAGGRWSDGLTAPDAWKAALAAAGNEPAWEHPLRPWIEATRTFEAKTVDSLAAAWAKVAAAYASETKRRVAHNASTFKTVADFRRGIPPEWSVDGVGLRDGPVKAGDFVVALDGPAAIAAVLPAGLFTHALSPRLNGAVRSPYWRTLPEPWLSLETCGGDFAAERTVVDNAFLTERQTYLARRDPQWSAYPPFPELAGRNVYREVATKASNPNFPPRVGLGGACSEAQAADPRSWFGLTRAVVSRTQATPLDELEPFATLFAGEAPTDLPTLARRYAAWWAGAVDRWARDEATDADARLLNWLLDQKLLPNTLDGPDHAPLAALVADYRRVERTVQEPQTVHGLADLDPGADYRLNERGEYDKLGPAVPRGYLGVLGGGAFSDPRSGRRDLAEQIASADNPLTARVYVNRIWHWVFGTGLVATPDDFGRLGDPPSHPELLDWLARRFVADGWSTKVLVRSLVLSAAFRQGSMGSPRAMEVDPDNRLLHHMSTRRLEAESVRDAILDASGRLDRRLYGPPVDPPRANEDPQKRLFSGPLDGQGRRSLYTKLTIMEPPRFLATFHQPPPKIPTGRRDRTEVPAQALTLLNDPFVVEQAKFWGRRIVASPDRTVDGRLATMLGAAFGRDAESAERDAWRGLVERLARERGVGPDRLADAVEVWADVAHTLFNAREFLYIR